MDLYSCRHTFATLAVTGGESTHNTAWAMGQTKSALVERVYAHGLASGMASAAATVGRVFGDQTVLRVVGGAESQRAVTNPLPFAAGEDRKTA
jgi:hypothetical protein